MNACATASRHGVAVFEDDLPTRVAGDGRTLAAVGCWLAACELALGGDERQRRRER
jgi:hypothetical protein